jgi:hypothetical protein
MAGVNVPDRLPAASIGTPLLLIELGPAPGGDARADVEPEDPGDLMLTCANCGARMDERKCKLICRCGYFLSCSDYY